nr:MAG TPA: hypothetical protein [Caudoviricetes sp.]
MSSRLDCAIIQSLRDGKSAESHKLTKGFKS